jgi:hypothetical protein
MTRARDTADIVQDVSVELALKANYSLPVNTRSGTTYTFALADDSLLTVATSASAQTFTIPPQSSVAWTANDILRVVNYGAGALTIVGGSGVTVTNTATTIAQYQSAAAIRTAENAWTLLPFFGSRFDVDYLVVAGGAGGGQTQGGGGGAGGLRSTISATGGGGSVESKKSITPGSAFTVTVGAGGGAGANGSNSVFSDITSTGGGAGASNLNNGASGGCGGGAGGDGGSRTGGSGTANQGFAGGNSVNTSGGGGGGSGAVGVTGTGGSNALGGVGVSNNITGSSVTYAAGGIGDRTITPENGAANTGNGGAGINGAGTAGSGGSGIVVIKFPDSISITVGGGLTSTNSTSGGFKIYTFTAGTGTVTF